MDDADLFHEATRFSGGRFDASRWPPWPGRLLEMGRKLLGSLVSACPGMPSVHLDLIDDSEVNACAFRHCNRFFIGVNVGTITALMLLYHRMLADRRCLAQIGNVHREVSDLRLVTRLTAKSVEMVPAMPHDQIRVEYANHLICLAFLFILRHEFVHVAHGHIGLLEKRFGVQRLAEFGSGSEPGLSPLDRQTLEWDADSIAVSNFVGWFHQIVADPSAVPPNLRHFVAELTEALYPLMFAIHSLFRLFGDSSLLGVDQSAIHHPPERVRRAIIGATTATYFLKKDAELGKAVGPVAAQAGLVDTELAFQALTGQTPDFPGLREVFCGEAGMNYLSRLSENWKSNLRDQLQPFAYIDLPE